MRFVGGVGDGDGRGTSVDEICKRYSRLSGYCVECARSANTLALCPLAGQKILGCLIPLVVLQSEYKNTLFRLL